MTSGESLDVVVAVDIFAVNMATGFLGKRLVQRWPLLARSKNVDHAQAITTQAPPAETVTSASEMLSILKQTSGISEGIIVTTPITIFL